MRVESVDQRGAALAITLTHSPDVANEVAAFDEIAKDQLRQDCRAAAIQSLHTGERVDQRGWNDEVADAQCREQRLVETAGVQDASAPARRIQGWHGMAVIPEFAIVVVLENPCVVPDGPVEKRLPALNRHDGTRRTLMGRRHIRESRPAAELLVHAD